MKKYKIYTDSDEEIEVVTGPGNQVSEVNVKKSINSKDILMVVIVVVTIALGIMWFLSSRQVDALREEKSILIQRLLVCQERTSAEIKETAKVTDGKINTIEDRKLNNRKNEKAIIDNPANFDVRNAENFLTEYQTTGN